MCGLSGSRRIARKRRRQAMKRFSIFCAIASRHRIGLSQAGAMGSSGNHPFAGAQCLSCADPPDQALRPANT